MEPTRAAMLTSDVASPGLEEEDDDDDEDEEEETESEEADQESGEEEDTEDDEEEGDEDEEELVLLPEEEGKLPEGGQAVCVVCQEFAAVATFIHGTTGHTACCVNCARRIQQHKQGCPVCRRPFVAVIRN